MVLPFMQQCQGSHAARQVLAVRKGQKLSLPQESWQNCWQNSLCFCRENFKLGARGSGPHMACGTDSSISGIKACRGHRRPACRVHQLTGSIGTIPGVGHSLPCSLDVECCQADFLKLEWLQESHDYETCHSFVCKTTCWQQTMTCYPHLFSSCTWTQVSSSASTRPDYWHPV